MPFLKFALVFMTKQNLRLCFTNQLWSSLYNLREIVFVLGRMCPLIESLNLLWARKERNAYMVFLLPEIKHDLLLTRVTSTTVLTGLQKPTSSFSFIVLVAILAFNFIYSNSQKE